MGLISFFVNSANAKIFVQVLYDVRVINLFCKLRVYIYGEPLRGPKPHGPEDAYGTSPYLPIRTKQPCSVIKYVDMMAG